MTEIAEDHERIWLQNAADAAAIGDGRLWCQDKVWPDDALDGEPTEYVRADLFDRLKARNAELEAGWEPIETCPPDVFVLLCSASKRQFVGRWVENVRWFEDYWRRPIGNPADGKWTGWRPLPAAPAKEEDNG